MPYKVNAVDDEKKRHKKTDAAKDRDGLQCFRIRLT